MSFLPFSASKPSHAHDYTKKETKLFQQLVTQVAQVSALGQGNNCRLTPVLKQPLSFPPRTSLNPWKHFHPLPTAAAPQHSLGRLLLSFRVLYRDPVTRNNSTLTPLGFKLQDYGCKKLSYVLLFTWYTRQWQKTRYISLYNSHFCDSYKFQSCVSV